MTSLSSAGVILRTLPVNIFKSLEVSALKQVSTPEIMQHVVKSGSDVEAEAVNFFRGVSNTHYGDAIQGLFCQLPFTTMSRSGAYQVALEEFQNAHRRTPKASIPAIQPYDLPKLLDAEAAVGTRRSLETGFFNELGEIRQKATQAQNYEKMDNARINLDRAAINTDMSVPHLGDTFSTFAGDTLEGGGHQKALSPLTRGADFTGVTFDKTHIINADLHGANLNNARLYDSTIRNSDLSEANMAELYGNGVRIKDSDLTGSKLQGSKLYNTSIQNTPVTGADFTEANLQQVNIENSEFTGTRFPGANLYRAKLRGHGGDDLNFQQAELSQATIELKASPHHDYKDVHAPNPFINLQHANIDDASLDFRVNVDGIINLKDTTGIPKALELTPDQTVVTNKYSDISKQNTLLPPSI
jgi:uncharacterized protein YjbI with pentapeptide repeats